MILFRHCFIIITGIKKVTETYKIGELKTDVVLCISNMVKDAQISMLSDDDFEEVFIAYGHLPTALLCNLETQ